MELGGVLDGNAQVGIAISLARIWWVHEARHAQPPTNPSRFRPLPELFQSGIPNVHLDDPAAPVPKVDENIFAIAATRQVMLHVGYPPNDLDAIPDMPRRQREVRRVDDR